jgi:hypothetical protein
MTRFPLPATEDQVRQFLLPLSAAVRRMGAPDRHELDLFARAAQIACCDLDADRFSPAAQLAALRRFEEFPSVAELRRFLLAPGEEAGAGQGRGA